METTASKRKSAFETRVHEIDFLRGFCIILMIIDHFFYDLMNFAYVWVKGGFELYNGAYSFASAYWTFPIRLAAHHIGVFIFVFLSGVSMAFSRNNWKRALRIICFAVALTVGSRIVTSISGSVFNFDFNIIHVLGISILIGCLLKKVPSWGLISISCGIFALSVTLYYLNKFEMIPLDNEVLMVILFPLGVLKKDYRYADYLPLIPSLGFFLLGMVFARRFYKSKASLIKRYEIERPVCFVGRHSLWFYIGHQVVIYGLFLIYSALCGMPNTF